MSYTLPRTTLFTKTEKKDGAINLMVAWKGPPQFSDRKQRQKLNRQKFYSLICIDDLSITLSEAFSLLPRFFAGQEQNIHTKLPVTSIIASAEMTVAELVPSMTPHRWVRVTAPSEQLADFDNFKLPPAFMTPVADEPETFIRDRALYLALM